jgi:23S rRNA pseudouridine2604 synthase
MRGQGDGGTGAREAIRLSKLMSERGLCSRREADVFIERGWVFVNGQRISELGTKVDPGCDVRLAAEARSRQERSVTILINKPIGYVSGQPEPGYKPALSLIGANTRWADSPGPAFHASNMVGLAPAGRLDIDSTGLLVFTQDGRIARQLVGEDSEIEKEYLVRVQGQLAPDGLKLLSLGLSRDGKRLKPARVGWQNKDQLRFELKEGRKRQIRRMCELVGLTVVGLKRVRIGGVRLGELPPGQWRYLADAEKF